MKKLLLKMIVYPVLGLVATLLFVFLLLPTDTLKQTVTQNAENFLGGKYAVEVGDLSLSLFGSITLQKLKLTPRPSTDGGPLDLATRIEADRRAAAAKAATEDGAAAAPTHHDDRCPADLAEAATWAARPSFIKQAHVSPSLMQLLGGGLDAPISLQLAQGTADLRLVHHPEKGTAVKGAMNNVQLHQLPILSQIALDKLPMFKLRGVAASFGADVDLTIAPKSGAMEGSIGLRVQDLALCLPELQSGKNAPPIPLPDLRLGDLNGTIGFSDDKRLSFTDLKAEGEDGALEVLGFVDMANPPRRPKPRFDLKIRLKFSDAYMQAGDLSMLDQFCPAGPDGFREIVVKGVEGEPGYQSRCTGAKNARTGAAPLPPRADSAPPPKPAPEPAPQPVKTAAAEPDPMPELPEPEYLPPPAPPPPPNPALLKQRNLAPGGVIAGSPTIASPAQRRQVLEAVKGNPDATDPAKMRKALERGKLDPGMSDNPNLTDRQERFRGLNK